MWGKKRIFLSIFIIVFLFLVGIGAYYFFAKKIIFTRGKHYARSENQKNDIKDKETKKEKSSKLFFYIGEILEIKEGKIVIEKQGGGRIIGLINPETKFFEAAPKERQSDLESAGQLLPPPMELIEIEARSLKPGDQVKLINTEMNLKNVFIFPVKIIEKQKSS